jgi:uncharacterized membrane protein YjfL (UPF0719 family)
MTRARYALALVATSGVLLALASIWKRETCSCRDSVLPLTSIAVWSAVAAAVAIIAYVAVGLATRRR